MTKTSMQSTQSVITGLVAQIYSGTAQQSYTTIPFYELDLDDLNDVQLDIDKISYVNEDLGNNLQELFQFIKKNNLANSSIVVDSEGLIIAQDKESYDFGALTASFPQFINMLTFSEYPENTSGFWIGVNNAYVTSIVIKVQETYYGIMMQCDKALSSQQTEALSKLFNTIINKGVNYE